MSSPARALILLCLLLLVQPAGAAPLPAGGAAPPIVAPASTTLVPLPRGCGDGLPPGDGEPVCCVFGYVFMDGRPVSGAFVSIFNVDTGERVETWTAPGPDSDRPYFRVSLSGPPLGLREGDTVGIYAAYSSRSVEIRHGVLGGGQQVDLVIPAVAGAAGRDYVLDRALYEQAPRGQLNMHLGDLTIDGSDTVYVTDWANARVQAFSLSGQSLLAWGTLGDAHGAFISPSGVAADGLGNVYVADYGAHTLSKFTRAGEFLGRWGGVGDGPGQLTFPSDVVVGPDGNLYVADTGNSRVQVFSPAGAPLRRLGSAGGGPGQLREPGGLAFGPDGNLYVADTGNSRVQVLTPAGAFVRAWGEAGGGPGQLAAPEELAFGPGGALYVSDRGNNWVLRFDALGNLLGQVGEAGVEAGQLNGAGGMAFSSDGRLFIADSYNGRVQIFTAAGSFAGQWGRPGDAAGRVFSVGGTALDGAGNLYAADASRGVVKQYSPSGELVRIFGRFGFGPGELNDPGGVAVGPSGDVYVADTGNNRVQQFTAAGAFVRSWGGPGAQDGLLDQPYALAAAPDGSIYVADTGNNRVQQFTAAGAFVRSWGGYGVDRGQFADPTGIAVGPDGTVYVAEFSGYRFQRFGADGQWLQTYGGPGASPGQLAQPSDLEVLPDGGLYVAERNVGRIQRFRPLVYTRPIATIVAATPRVVAAGQPVELLGMGADSDATPGGISYEWRLDDAAQPFSSGAAATLPTAGLAPGEHTVSLRVRDGEGELSDPQRLTITVAERIPETPRSWTFLLYLAGDNAGIADYLDDESALGALYRLRARAGGANVTVVALFDGDRPGGGDSLRYVLRPGRPAQVEQLGEVNTGDPQTLADFVEWGRRQAPADAYYLAIADHGNAVDGIAWDFTSDPQRRERLSPPRLRQALALATDGGARPLDVVHFDACLMGLLETAYQVRGLARYAIVSENLAWSSFAYADYRDLVGESAAPRDLAVAIADSYADRIARDRLPLTVSVLDLARVDQAALAADALAGELLRYALAGAENRAALQALRDRAQKLDSSGDGGITQNDEYVDLDHWAELVSDGLADGPARAAAARLRAALADLVAHNRSQSGEGVILATGAPVQVDLSHARGLAVYFPRQPSLRTTEIYRNQLTFAADTRWDEWLQAQLAALGPWPPAPAPNPVAPPPPPRSAVYLPLIRR